MRVVVNGTEREVPDASTVLDVVGAIGVGHEERGVAVAVAGAVVPRGAWSETVVLPHARLEVLRATAGG